MVQCAMNFSLANALALRLHGLRPRTPPNYFRRIYYRINRTGRFPALFCLLRVALSLTLKLSLFSSLRR